MTYNFNKNLKNGEGQLVGMKIIKPMDEIAAIGMGSAHAVLGHQSYLLISSTATKLGMRAIRYEGHVCKQNM